MYKVRITVIKREFYPDIANKYLTSGEEVGACPVHNTGDVYIYRGNNEKPAGLCDSAWLDICRAVTSISNGATYHPWNKSIGQTIGCCGDGIRPVIFEITRMEDENESMAK